MPKFKIANKVYNISDDQVGKFKALAQTKGYKVEEVFDEGKNIPQGTGAPVEKTQAPGMEFNLGDTSLDISKGDGKKANDIVFNYNNAIKLSQDEISEATKDSNGDQNLLNKKLADKRHSKAKLFMENLPDEDRMLVQGAIGASGGIFKARQKADTQRFILEQTAIKNGLKVTDKGFELDKDSEFGQLATKYDNMVKSLELATSKGQIPTQQFYDDLEKLRIQVNAKQEVFVKAAEEVDKQVNKYLEAEGKVASTTDILDYFQRSYSDTGKILKNTVPKALMDITGGIYGVVDAITLDKIPGIDKARKGLIDTSNYLSEEARTLYGKKISDDEAFSSISNFVDYSAETLLDNLPTMALAFSGAGTASFFLSGFGAKAAEIELTIENAKRDLPELKEQLEKTTSPSAKAELQKTINSYEAYINSSDLKKDLISITYGAVEAGTEKFFGAGAFAKNLAVAAKTSFLTKNLKEAAGKYLGSVLSSQGMEIAGEEINTLVGNFLDIVAFDEDKNIFDGWKATAIDAMIIGGGYGSVTGSVNLGGFALNLAQDSAAKKGIRNDIAELRRVYSIISNKRIPKNDSLKLDAKNKALEIKNRIAASAEMSIARMTKLSNEELYQLGEFDRNKRKLVKEALRVSQMEGLTDDQKKNIIQKLNVDYKKEIESKDQFLNTAGAGKPIRYLGKANEIKLLDVIGSDIVSYQNSMNSLANLAKGLGIDVVLAKDKADATAQLKERGIEEDFKGFGAIYGNDKTVVINYGGSIDALINGKSSLPLSTAAHELLHGILSKSFGNEKIVEIGNKLADHMLAISNNKTADTELRKKARRVLEIRERYKAEGFADNVVAEEMWTAISDVFGTGEGIAKISNEVGGLTEIAQNFKDAFNFMLGKESGIEMNTAEDAINFIADYNRSFVKGKLSRAAKKQMRAQTTFASYAKSQAAQFLNTTPKYQLSDEENDALAEQFRANPDSLYRNKKAMDLIAKVAKRVTQKFYDPIADDAKRGVDRSEYEMSALSELAIIAKEWNPDKQDFGKFLANRGFLRLTDLAKRLGIESTEAYGGVGIAEDVETSKEAQKQETVDIDIEERIGEQIKDKSSFSEGIPINNVVDGKPLKEHLIGELAKAAKLGITRYNDEISKNRTVTPFIASIKDDMAEAGRKIVKKFINEYGYEQFLIDNKELILDNYTTTYLSKHPLLKKGIQKSINGQWVSPIEVKPGVYDFVDAKGNKYPRGSFDRETAGVSGKTSGPELIRRHPDINNVIRTGEFVNYHFDDGPQRKKKKQNPEDALARQIGAELGFDLLKEDLLNSGEVSKQIAEVADLRGIVLGEAGIEKILKDVDRGTVKLQLAEGDIEKVSAQGQLILDAYNSASPDSTFKAIYTVLEEILPGKPKTDLNRLAKLLNTNLSAIYEPLISNKTTPAQAQKIANAVIFDSLSLEDGVALIVGGYGLKLSNGQGNLTRAGQKLADFYVQLGINAIKPLGKNLSIDEKLALIGQFITFNGRALRNTNFLGNNVYVKKLIIDPIINSVIDQSQREALSGRIKLSETNEISIDGKRIGVPSAFNISLKEKQYKILGYFDVFNIFANRAKTELLNQYDAIKELGDLEAFKAWVAIQNESRSLARLAAHLVEVDSDLDRGGKNTTWEHKTPLSQLMRWFALNFIDENLVSKETLIRELRDYEVALVNKDIDQALTDANRKENVGEDYDANDPNTKAGEKRYNDSLTPEQKGRLVRLGMSQLTDYDVKTFDKMVSAKTGIEGEIGEAIANRLGKNKGKFRFFIPPSADDFMGLMYYLLGSGAQGDADIKFIKEKLVDPFASGVAALESYKQNKLSVFKGIKKSIKGDPQLKLSKQNKTGFTNEQSLRIYLWAKAGHTIPSITAEEQKAVIRYVNDTPGLLNFARQMQNLFAAENGYPAPQNNWFAGTMTIDILDFINDKGRTEFLKEYIENSEALFGKLGKNGEITGPIANKLKAEFGSNYIEALSDVLYRMKNGRGREFGKNRLANKFNNWISNAVGSIMFLNTRSALLQQVSLVNFINLSDNNPIAFAKALANPEQYAADYVKLLNSDFLKQRRGGLSIDVNEDEIAKAAAGGGNTVSNIISVILKKGFVLTTWADSHAIASGGATFYRNRINTYVKQGLSIEEAEAKAFFEFKELAEESQQSSRPDKISQQQASSLGRIILAFANTPMQYARITKKAALDLINRRGDWKTNTSKLLYYGALQNIMFTYMQQALFALAFDDDDEEDSKKDEDRYIFAASGMADGFLRGLGFGGAVVSTAKNMVLEAIEQEQGRKDYDEVVWKALTLSPPLSSKIDKARSVARTFTWKQQREKIFTEGASLDNPIYEAVGKTTSVLTNIPLDRVVRKVDNITVPLRQDVEFWQAFALYMGYGKYELDLYEKPKKKKAKATRGRSDKKVDKRTVNR